MATRSRRTRRICAVSQVGNIDGRIAGTHQDVAAGNRIQAVGGTQQGGFAGAGQSHQHRNLALCHAQGGAGHADDDPEFALDLGPGAAGIEGRQGLANGLAAVAPPLLGEENIDVLKFDRCRHRVAPCSWVC